MGWQDDDPFGTGGLQFDPSMSYSGGGGSGGGGFNLSNLNPLIGIGSGVGAFLGGIGEDVFGQGAQLQKQAQDYLQKAANVRMQAAQQGKSAYNSVDPSTRGAMMDTLSQMRRVGSQGFTPEDQAAISNTLRQTGTADRGAREAILNHMNATGMGGGSNDMLAQLTSEQNQYDKANQSGADLAAAGRARQLEAMRQAGSLAGGIRGQDYEAAGANDAVSRFNALNQQQANAWNAGNEAGGDRGLSNYYSDQAQRDRQKWVGGGQAIGGAIGGAAGFM